MITPVDPGQPASPSSAAVDRDHTVRWRLDISYRGTNFSGWARQPDQRTVQGTLETWIPRVLRLDRSISLVCAGRTDAGVHARGQVCHLDLGPDDITDDGETLLRRLARVLPDDLAVPAVRPAPAGFDARFSAIWRRYVYRLDDRTVGPDPLHRDHITWWRCQLDVEAMNEAAAGLLGLRDFAAFCRSRQAATTIRNLITLKGHRIKEGPLTGVIEFQVISDAFCHSMVRSLIGALARVGEAARDSGWPGRVAEAGVRDPSVPVISASGLTLEEVGYPAADQLAARATEARQMRSTSD